MKIAKFYIHFYAIIVLFLIIINQYSSLEIFKTKKKLLKQNFLNITIKVIQPCKFYKQKNIFLKNNTGKNSI